MLIAEVFSSKRDVNGNRYHVAKVENRDNGKRMFIDIDSPGNLEHALPTLFGDWETSKKHSYFVEKTLPIREFNRFSKNAVYPSVDLCAAIKRELSPIVGIVD